MPLLPVADALSQVLNGVAVLPSEDVALPLCRNRTLASAVAALITQPPFDSSAMDGYAVRAADLSNPGTTLSVIGESRAGVASPASVEPGDAVRIFTGAPLPSGADTVIIQEDVRVSQSGTRIALTDARPSPGANIRPRGQDFAIGDMLLSAGHCLTARDILLAASAGHATLEVVRRPRVALLATGDELVAPGLPLASGQVYASNGYGLAALIDGAGGDPVILPTAADTDAALREQIVRADDCDILVTIGGASVGDHDRVRPALECLGAELAFHKVAMRPGKPMFFGARRTRSHVQRIVGLPGNPVSAMISARIFLQPLIQRLLGRSDTNATFTAHLTAPLAANGPRDHYIRAQLTPGTMPPRVTPLARQDSSLMTVLAHADVLIIVPANAPARDVGDDVTVMAFDF